MTKIQKSKSHSLISFRGKYICKITEIKKNIHINTHTHTEYYITGILETSPFPVPIVGLPKVTIFISTTTY